MTALEKIAQRKAKLRDEIDAKARELRQTNNQEREETRRLHARHLWSLAKVLEETGLATYDAETLRPWMKDLAVRIAQGEQAAAAMGDPPDSTPVQLEY